MFYVTDLDDTTQVVIEAETSSAFAKSDLEVRPNPQHALVNAMNTASDFAKRLVLEFREAVDAAGGEAELAFSMKCDHTGLVMIAMNPEEGQLRVSLKMRPSGSARRKSTSSKPAWQRELELANEVGEEQDITDQ